MRNKGNYCKARVRQNGDNFTTNADVQTHTSEDAPLTKAVIVSQVNSRAKVKSFPSAATIVQDVMEKELVDPQPGLPNPALLTRNANRQRRKGRPKYPDSSDFEVHEVVSRDFWRPWNWKKYLNSMVRS